MDNGYSNGFFVSCLPICRRIFSDLFIEREQAVKETKPVQKEKEKRKTWDMAKVSIVNF